MTDPLRAHVLKDTINNQESRASEVSECLTSTSCQPPKSCAASSACAAVDAALRLSLAHIGVAGVRVISNAKPYAITSVFMPLLRPQEL